MFQRMLDENHLTAQQSYYDKGPQGSSSSRRRKDLEMIHKVASFMQALSVYLISSLHLKVVFRVVRRII